MVIHGPRACAFVDVIYNIRHVVDWINTRCVCAASHVLIPSDEAAAYSVVARGFAGIEVG